jgi:DDE superfamily endonuclease
MEPPPDALRAFRRSFYECSHRRSDALFELADAILTADGAAPSPAHLSLQASHRRGWGSLYAALDRGRIDEEALRKLLARYPLALGATEGEPSVYAVDVSVWDRCDAECSPERGFYYHPSRHSAGQPIVAGWAYQWIAQNWASLARAGPLR